MVADGVDDLAAARGHRRKRRAKILVRAQDLGGRRLGKAEQFHHVAGQHHGERAGLAVEVARQHLAGAAGHVGTVRGQVQVADGDHLAARRDVHLEQLGDLRSRRGHGRCGFLPPGSHRVPSPGT